MNKFFTHSNKTDVKGKSVKINAPSVITIAAIRYFARVYSPYNSVENGIRRNVN
ncbi:MAG: hypothetical protein Q4F97_04895 [Bacteroidales bacterium]|nr:hypothetical protein [Bacteroidales bacterium]